MSQTLKQKAKRKRKKMREKIKNRIGKNVVFTDRVGDAKRKQAAQTHRLVEKYKTPSYYW